MLTLVLSIALAYYVSLLQKRPRSRRGYHKRYVLTPFHVFLIGLFLSGAMIFVPIYFKTVFFFEDGFVRVHKTALISLHNAMRLFILDGDFETVQKAFYSFPVLNVGEGLATVYTVYSAVLYVVAPVMTAGFVLTLFKNAKAQLVYFFKNFSDMYYMSELNERSIALAEDIMKGAGLFRPRTVVFGDVFEKNEEESYELIVRARRMGALLFSKDITEIGLKPSNPFIHRKVYLIGEDVDENLNQALLMLMSAKKKRFYEKGGIEFYVFSDSAESEALLNAVDAGKMKLRRIYESRNFAIRTLKEHSIFADAIEKDGKKLLNIVIAGIGGIGSELLKAICWCGQMYGYELNVHVFDITDDLKTGIESKAPELISMNGKRIAGEPYYNIVFHDEVNVGSVKFLQALSEIGEVSTAFVTLGDDELNIETAMRMRMQFGRDNIADGRRIPPILAVVYSDLKSETITHGKGLRSIKNDSYGIELIGDLSSNYTLDAIEQLELEGEGLKCHLRWSSTAEEREKATALYEKYEYYRRSSIAEALHAHFRRELGLVPGFQGGAHDKEIEETEHKRWNAYMRGEGFVGAKVRNEVAKTHYDLIPYEELSQEEKDKDAIVIGKELK